MHRISIVLFSVSVIFIASCGITSDQAITAQSFQSSFKNVALTNMSLPPVLNERDDIAAFYQATITELFTQHGLTVLPPSLYENEFKKQNALLGSFIDPITGKRDLQQYQKIRAATFAVLAIDHQVDSVLMYDIRTRKASIGSYQATWDGQQEPFGLSSTDISNFLGTLLPNSQSSVPALSLMVYLKDNQDNQIYMGAGGIQLIAKLNSSDEFEYVPVDMLLRNQNSMAFSVKEAFRQLFDTTK